MKVTRSCLSLCNPIESVAHSAPLSMEFSRQEYWRGLPFPSPGDLSEPRIKPGSPALQADSLPCQIQKIIYCMILFLQHCRRGKTIRTETQLVHDRDPGKWEGRDHKRAWEILWDSGNILYMLVIQLYIFVKIQITVHL